LPRADEDLENAGIISPALGDRRRMLDEHAKQLTDAGSELPKNWRKRRELGKVERAEQRKRESMH